MRALTKRKTKGRDEVDEVKEVTETEQSTTVLLYIHCLPFVCGKSLAKE